MAYCTKCGTKLTKISENTAECENCGARFYVKSKSAGKSGVQNGSRQRTSRQSSVSDRAVLQDKPGKFQHLGRLISGIALFVLYFGDTTPYIMFSPVSPVWARVVDAVWRLLSLIKTVMGVLTIIFVCLSNSKSQDLDYRQDKYDKACRFNKIGWICCGVGLFLCFIVTFGSIFFDVQTSDSSFDSGIISDFGEDIVGSFIKIPSMDEADVNAYFGNIEDSSEMTIMYEDGNGVEFLSAINDNASTKLTTSWLSSGSSCKLTGQYDCVWYYGWGTKDKILVAYGSDKDLIYSTMQAYEEMSKV